MKAERLRDLVREFDVEVDSYRDRESLIAALADGRRIDFANVLNLLSREELKGMCSELGLDASGKEKDTIIDRILRDAGAEDSVADEDLGSEPEDAGRASSYAPSSQRKRVALDTLKADRLRDLVRGAGISVDTYRDRDALIGALADGRRVDFSVVLQQLSREELKRMCAVLNLDSTGKEKEALARRLLGATPAELMSSGVNDEGDSSQPREAAIVVLERLTHSVLTLESRGRGWPALGTVQMPTGRLPVTIYVRSISRSGRSRPTERRFQNPADPGARLIEEPSQGYALLFGVWNEQGDARAVIVAMDAYRRLKQDTRVSLFMPLALLEEAADTGYAEHRSHSGEVIAAFRPQNLPAYVERLQLELPVHPRGPVARDAELEEPRVLPRVAILSPVQVSEGDYGVVHIRPKVGMYAAFARLNYRPWFAIAEFVDNSIQSHVDRVKQSAEAQPPLLVDIRIDEDEIVVTDRAGGIAWRDFPRAFSPSQPPPDPLGLSEFGLGMKAAACWFAREWSVRTSALGEPLERTIEFDIPRITHEGIESLPVTERPAAPEDHFTVVTLKNLRVRPKGRTIAKIKEHLTSIYRVLISKGIVRLRLSTGTATDELAYSPPKLLHAPHFREPDGEPRDWRTEFSFTLEGGRRVWGWAGLLEVGSPSRAGFSVFRRDRLIQGSVDETYRPAEIFRTPNSYTYQRLIGEIFVDGFDVSHTKDGIQWDGLEDVVVSRLRIELNRYDLPLLQQAEGYRARRAATDLEAGFGTAALTSTGGALATESTGEVLAQQLTQAETAAPETAQTRRAPAERTLTKRTFPINVPSHHLPWCVTVELISDRSRDWFERGSETKVEERAIHVLVNLSHPFSEQFINDSEATLNPILRIVCGLALAEETAREAGIKQAGVIRRNLNQLLRVALSTVAREVES